MHLDSHDNLHYFYRAASRFITERVVTTEAIVLNCCYIGALLNYMTNPRKDLMGFCGDLFDILGPSTFLPNRNHTAFPLTEGFCVYGQTERCVLKDNMQSFFFFSISLCRRYLVETGRQNLL